MGKKRRRRRPASAGGRATPAEATAGMSGGEKPAAAAEAAAQAGETATPAETEGEERARAEEQGVDRRSFLGQASTVGMLAGLGAGYGALGLMAARFMYPAKPRPTGWMYVIETRKMKPGDALIYKSPGGEKIAIARRGKSGEAKDFLALSSTCPHLGCQVHWEPGDNRFFCPCHNGVFDPTGKALEGPPAEAGQSLLTYPLKVEEDLLFIQVPVETLSTADASAGTVEPPGGPSGPGHDPCLFERPEGEEA